MPILTNIAQLAACPAGNAQQDAGLLRNAALVWRNDKILWVGRHCDTPPVYRSEPVSDGGGRLVVPGLVDCHTHLCFGGWRGDEFEAILRGVGYSEIAAAGGGIASTVAATRGSSQGALLRKTLSHLDSMLRLGVTTVECKSGYGLDTDNELKQLEVYRQAALQHAITLVPTFLGAHIVPREHQDHRDRYVHLLCEELLPEVARRKLAFYCDIFVEQGAFTVGEARRVLAAARHHGLGVKVHADQLSDGGGAQLAAEMSAVSAEHLEYVSPEGIQALAAAGVTAVSLPLASLYLRQRYLPARQLLEQGVAVAVATDFNPGSAPSYHLPLALTLACLNQGMTPAEALMGATTIAARAIGRQDSIGSLQPGYQADFALIDAPDLNHWLYHFRDNACVGVVKRGDWVWRQDFQNN
jgi:imidazolonepropionase